MNPKEEGIKKGLEKEEEARTHPPETDSLRRTEDQADVDRAIELLTSDLRTEAIGWELGRQHNTRPALEIAGWRWLRAAEKILDPATPQSRRRFPYFVGIAKALGDDERIRAPINSGSRSGTASPGRRVNEEDREREFREAFLASKSMEVTRGQ